MLASVLCACSAHGEQKRAFALLEAELQMAMSHHVGAGDEPESSVGAVIALNSRAIYPFPEFLMCKNLR